MKTRFAVGIAAAALAMSVAPPAQAGPVECVFEKFWHGEWVECPDDFMNCVNDAWWAGELVVKCVVTTPPGVV